MVANVAPQTRRTRRRNGDEGAGLAEAMPHSLDLSILATHLGYVLRRAQLAIFKDFIQTLAGVDIRPAQYSVLIVIARNPGLTQAALGRALAIKRANLVGLLDELERRGLARRAPSPEDRRSHVLFLTARGRGLLRRCTRLAELHERHASRTLSAREKKSLLEMLQRVASSL